MKFKSYRKIASFIATTAFAVVAPQGTIWASGGIKGIVVGPTGKPIPNAEVVVSQLNSAPLVSQTGPRGDFSMALHPGDTILARYQNLGTPVVVTYSGQKSLVIRLKAGALCTIKGQVTSEDGTPVADAWVKVFIKTNGSDLGLETAHTDIQGAYSLPAVYQNSTYYVQAAGPVHDRMKSADFFIHPAQTIHTMPLTLMFADDFAGGVILGPDGNPYFGAVITRENGTSGITFKTDESGRFMMNNVPRKRVHIFIQTSIGNVTEADLKAGISDNVVRLPDKAIPK